MANTKTIHTVIKVRRGTTEEWLLNKDVVPAAGEPCLDKETGRVVYGDGVLTYEKLLERDKKNDALAVLLSEQGGLKQDENGGLSIEGYSEATEGQVLSKGAEGVEWKDVYSKEEVDDKVTSVFKYKGKVQDQAALEEKKESSVEGDVYYVTDEDEFYIFNGTEFESFGSATNFATKEELEALKEEIKNDEAAMIETIKAAGIELPIIDKVVDIPIAKTGAPGLVKPSDKENGIDVDSTGRMWVNSLNVMKLTQTVGDTFIIDGGEAGGLIVGTQEYFDDIINDAIKSLNVVIPEKYASISEVADKAVGIQINDTSDETTIQSIYASLVPQLLAVLTSNTNAISKIKYKEKDLTIDGNIQFTAVEQLFSDLAIYKTTKLKELIGKTFKFTIVTTENQEYEYTVNFTGPVGKYSVDVPDTEHTFGTTTASDMQGNVTIAWTENKGKVSGISKVYTMKDDMFENAKGHYIGLTLPGHESQTVTASQPEFAKQVASTNDWIFKLDGLVGEVTFTADDVQLCSLDFSGVTLNHLTGEAAFVEEKNHGTSGDPAKMYDNIVRTWTNNKCVVTGALNKITTAEFTSLKADGYYFGFTLDKDFIGKKLSVTGLDHQDTDIETATENELDWVLQVQESNKTNGIMVYADDKQIATFNLDAVTLNP